MSEERSLTGDGQRRSLGITPTQLFITATTFRTAGRFRRSDHELDSVAALTTMSDTLLQQKLDTVDLIRKLWENTDPSAQETPGFMKLLIQCSWNSQIRKPTRRSVTEPRNRLLARYFNIPAGTDATLEGRLESACRFLVDRGKNLLQTPTGLCNCRGPIRAKTYAFLARHSGNLAALFHEVSSREPPTEEKIESLMKLIDDTAAEHGSGVALLNGMTPVLACLDPARMFPLINGRTRWFLNERFGAKRHPVGLDRNGAALLLSLLSSGESENSMQLDVHVTEEYELEGKTPNDSAKSSS
jgi:hypothetical protein